MTVMLVTYLKCWWQNPYIGDFFNAKIRSPTSQIGHRHLKLVTKTNYRQRPSPTSVANIECDYKN